MAANVELVVHDARVLQVPPGQVVAKEPLGEGREGETVRLAPALALDGVQPLPELAFGALRRPAVRLAADAFFHLASRRVAELFDMVRCSVSVRRCLRSSPSSATYFHHVAP